VVALVVVRDLLAQPHHLVLDALLLRPRHRREGTR
jgi:hypothetical protein